MSFNRWRQALLTLVAAALTTACSDAPKTSDTDLQQIQYPQLVELLANPAKPSGSGLKFWKRGSGTGQTVLLDVRPPVRYAQGHLPGAVNIPLPDLEAGDKRLAEATTIVVYAGGWGDYLSAAGAKKLMALGYQNVFEFRGGVQVWQDEGRSLEKSE